MTRHDFRVKVDLSRVFKDARRYSWIFVDSTKIFDVRHLANRVQEVFGVSQPFHLLSTHEDTNVFLPLDEDVRVLENNDTVLIVPGTGINESSEVSSGVKRGMNYEELEKDISVKYKHPRHDPELNFPNGFEKEEFETSKISQNLDASTPYLSDKSYMTTNNITINKTDLAANSFYRTALHDTMEVETNDSKMAVNGDNSVNSVNDDSLVSTKRKRVRSRKKKTKDATISESDISMNETNNKKPKVVSSVLLPSGKHIRFEGLDDDSSEFSESNNSTINTSSKTQVNGSNGVKNNAAIKNDLSNLLSMGQSSTPLTFSYKKPRKEMKISEKLIEVSDSMEYQNFSNKQENQNSSIKQANGQENSQLAPPATPEPDTYSFKVFRISENYTPQVSSVILGRILARSKEGSQLTMKILHGKDQLRDPEGKFALPKEDEEDEVDKDNDIITIEKEKLLEFTKIKALDTSL
ncbi:uncharacterized protein LOC106650668 [Trichogramma pretiosum]|uniref:uncharacterized protein LOC106650668 n=1 Tax=Trichogramma pretiosum TaxID=7493 RepID=UPI0006C96E62|nr:uncharacterized protein LOC106650668 [Trichogramma pretiosum]